MIYAGKKNRRKASNIKQNNKTVKNEEKGYKSCNK